MTAIHPAALPAFAPLRGCVGRSAFTALRPGGHLHGDGIIRCGADPIDALAELRFRPSAPDLFPRQDSA